jgi:hypothetical protein
MAVILSRVLSSYSFCFCVNSSRERLPSASIFFLVLSSFLAAVMSDSALLFALS